ncbi:transposase, partial [Erysipelotrichaceae bacterium RD49]|nr:transposase [Erysipelotrichaceae bacterium RD49]
MTHTLNNSMAGFIPECNISFNGGDLSSDTGAILPLDFINSNSLLQPYADLPFSDERQSCKGRNSNFSLLTQQVFKYILGYSSQADQEVLAKDPILCQYFQGISSQSSVSRFFSRVCQDTNNAFWRAFMDQACRF